MSQERQIYLPRLTNVSGDFVGVGRTMDGRAAALYAQTRLRPLQSKELMDKPRILLREIEDNATQYKNIKVVDGSIAIGNGSHLELLVKALQDGSSNPMQAFSEWLYSRSNLALPKPPEETRAELHPNERLYTARMGGVVTKEGSAMITVWDKNGRAEGELVMGLEDRGVMRITSNYRNNTFSPGDYFAYQFTHDNPKELARQMIQEFPPITALYKQVTILFYDLENRAGHVAEAVAAPSKSDAIVVNAMEVVVNTNRMLTGKAKISERYADPLPSADGQILERNRK